MSEPVEPLPDELEDRILAALELDEVARATALDHLLAEHPDHAAAIRAYATIAAGGEPTRRNETPRRVGRYTLLEELGRGGQGAVYRAHDEDLGRDVAVKLLASHWLRSPNALKRFRREAEVTSRLDHPGICQVYEVGEHDGVPFLAMRNVPGEPLAARIDTDRTGTCVALPELRNVASGAGGGTSSSSTSRARSDLGCVARLVERAARALHVAHDAGVVHRDVKPGNLIVTPDGECVVMDFGMAYADDDAAETLTRSGDLFGTPAYMAPEQIQGAAVDRRADVWALGVTLYECLTQRRPFVAPTRDGLLRVIVEAEPIPVRTVHPGVHRDLATIVQVALEKDPGRRYETAEALADDLRAFCELRPIAARPIGPLRRAGRWILRNRAASAALALATALVVGIPLASVAARASQAAENERTLRRAAERERAQRSFSAARRHAERGNWLAALRGYEAALRDGLDDETAAIGLGVVDAWLGMSYPNAARHAVEAVLALDSLTEEQRARALLARGALTSRNQDPAAGLDDVRAAVALGVGLDEADRHYARSLLAADLDSAVEAACESLDADPFHVLAFHAVGPLLFFAGRVDELHARATLRATLFPEDPIAAALSCVASRLQGDDAAARTAIDRLGRTDAELADLVGRMIDLLTGLIDTFDDFQVKTAEGRLGRFASLGALTRASTAIASITRLVGQIDARSRDDRRPRAELVEIEQRFGGPAGGSAMLGSLHPIVTRLARELPRLLFGTLRQDHESLRPVLERLSSLGSMQFFELVLTKTDPARSPWSFERPEQFAARCDELERAIASPGIVPCRAMLQLELLMVRLLRMSLPAGTHDDANRAGILRLADACIDRGHAPSTWFDLMLNAGRMRGDPVLHRTVAERWFAFEPTNRRARLAVARAAAGRGGNLSLGQRACDEALADAPNDVDFVDLRAVLRSYAARAFGLLPPRSGTDEQRPIVVTSFGPLRDPRGRSFTASWHWRDARAVLRDGARFGPGGVVERATDLRAPLDAIGSVADLADVDVVVVCAPLRAGEADTLAAFVAGGGALLACYDEVAAELGTAFGLDPGTDAEAATAGAPDTAHPLTHGPFGETSTIEFGAGGSFARSPDRPEPVLASRIVTVEHDRGRVVLIADDDVFMLRAHGAGRWNDAAANLLANALAWLTADDD